MELISESIKSLQVQSCEVEPLLNTNGFLAEYAIVSFNLKENATLKLFRKATFLTYPVSLFLSSIIIKK